VNELQEYLALNLRLILENTATPITAGPTFASRNASLANGTSGLLLALIDFNKDVSLKRREQDFSSTHDIFSSSLALCDSELRVASGDLSQSDKDFGDIFLGFCNRYWTAICLGISPPLSQGLTGAVTLGEPSLAHGNLIRDFTNYMNHGDFSADFSDKIPSLDRPGWCNGNAGVAATLATLDSLSGRSPRYEEQCLSLSRQSVDYLRQMGTNIAFSLCHGAGGVLVILAGLFRLYGCPEFFELATQVKDLIEKHIQTSQPEGDLYFDNSWLTGNAGALWSLAAYERTPTLNPLLPTDSSLYR